MKQPFDDKGQALALGVFGLLFLAIGMYMTASLGRHVHQKIHVQTTADAVALSLAQLEAQSFNYTALANRAQVAHYVTIMNANAFVSYASGVENFTITTAAALNAIDAITSACSALAICAVLKAFAATKELFWAGYQIVNPIVGPLDELVGKVTPLIEKLNHALWVTTLVMGYIVWVHLEAGGEEVFQAVTAKNDKDWSGTRIDTVLNLVTGVFNVKSYLDTFNNAGGKPFGSSGLNPEVYAQSPDSVDAEVKRAQRIMTELANATRFDRSVSRRDLAPFPGVVDFSGISDALRKLPKSIVGRLGGETKLTGESVTGKKLDSIFSTLYGVGSLSRAEVLASADEWLWSEGAVWIKSGTATSYRSEHWRTREKKYNKIPPVTKVAGALLVALLRGKRPTIVPTKGFTQDEDPNHRFGGISPYLLYDAGPDSNQFGGAFRQPSVFVWLHKSQDQAGFARSVAFSWSTRKRSASIATRIGRTASKASDYIPMAAELTGVHAFSRAQAYYHRPGNWAEPPNFFNPFWKARLAPVLGTPAIEDSAVWKNLAPFLGQNLIFH